MLKFLKYLLLTPLVLLFIWILFLNIKLYHQPKIIQSEQGRISQEVLYQLHHLKKQFGKGAAQDMQRLFPEGFIFLHSLSVLTWGNALNQRNSTDSSFPKGKFHLISLVLLAILGLCIYTLKGS